MIVYSAIKKDFVNEVFNGVIEDKILTSFIREMGHSTGKSELRSWQNSMRYMRDIVNSADIPDTAGIAIEYKLPQTAKRIDFIISGADENNKKTIVVVELKQWEKAEATDMDGIVKTYVGQGVREVSHPSYQVWSYAMLLEDYNSNIQDEKISVIPCAYLHNYIPDNAITSQLYEQYLHKAPLFMKYDAQKLQDFVKKYVKHGDNKEVLYLIENGKIQPSKSLADSLASMLKGNREFVMIDDQKLVFEMAMKLALHASEETKQVLIVEGGPGTGKSVVAIHLLTELTKKKQVSQYITRNSAPRKVYEIKLTGSYTKSRISNMFRSSGSFFDVPSNTFDTLVIDEAHRLTEKSGMFSNLGENQIKELINASKCSIFFVDEDQKVTFKDIGDSQSIERWAKELGATVHKAELASQFRCNGSDGYLAWIDNTLQIRDTANDTLEGMNYDFQVFDDPEKLHEVIREKNKSNNKSRMLAGYCWNWISKKDALLQDIIIGNYQARWNLDAQGQAWIVHPKSVSEVGCIHTCQGLELDYAGVIIGPDLIVRDGVVITDATKRAKTDISIKGFKAMLKNDEQRALKTADRIIKNTYRTLMTRGMKGCYIYCTDKETGEWFKMRIGKMRYDNNIQGASMLTDSNKH